MNAEKQLDSLPKLSILLATVLSRADLFSLLHTELLRQSEGKSVELVVACDNKEISIGKKRQNLLEQAKGQYVVFIDDDDWVADTYVDDLLIALETEPDCVGFKISCTANGGNPESAITSIRYPKWGDNQDGFRFVRSIYHKSPVRRDLAINVGFPDLRYGEDRVFSEGIMRHLKTEVFVDRVLYFYRYRHENFATKYGFPKKVKKGVDPNHKRRPFQH